MPRFNKAYETADNSPMVLFSEVIEEHHFLQGEFRVCCYTDDHSSGLIYQVSLCAQRPSGGDVTLNGLIEWGDDDFGGQKPVVYVVANTSVQAIQIVAEGLANVPITWTCYTVMAERRD